MESDTILQMLMMSICTALITSFSGAIIHMAAKIFNEIKELVGKIRKYRYNYVSISDEKIFSPKKGWISNYGEGENWIMAEAVCSYLQRRNKYPKEVSINLGSAIEKNNSDDVNSWWKSKIFVAVPKGEITHENFYIDVTNKTDNEKDSIKTKKKIITIRSKQSMKEIHNFIRTCYNEYMDIKYPTDGKQARKFYAQIFQRSGIALFHKYDIPEPSVMFSDIFFPEKQSVIGLLDKLEAKKIKKLGFLLYGEPGTGKSSLIKAIAQYTRRHIEAIKLSFVRNDSELLRILHNSEIGSPYHNDMDYRIEYMNIPLNKRIYVLEDIDAETDIVLKRTNVKKETTKYIDEDTTDEKSKDEKKSRWDSIISLYDNRGPTLSGILNVLDGVLELVGSIIIMTTNHPEKLDPALIRHGRVNMQIEMRRMRSVDASAMIKKFFGKRVREKLIPDNMITPCQLEALCQRCSSIEELEREIQKTEFR